MRRGLPVTVRAQLARLAVTQTCAVPPDLWIMGSCSQLRVQKSSKHDEPTNTPHADHVVYAGYYSVKLQPSWLQQHAKSQVSTE
jgi:hypothetical protein